uniref:Uncharacterized protein n=1 Tax=Romanomermis culicivorax TaxID=13658 RepID=A0A915JVF4_ROMCU
MSNVVEIPHVVKSRNFILLKSATLTNNKKNCSAEAAAASIISSSTKVLRSADLNEFSIKNNTKRLILPNKSRLAPITSSLENGKNTTFIFLPVSLALTTAEKQCEEVNLIQSTAKMDDLADTFKFKSASAASSLQSYNNGGGGGNGFYVNGHFDERCLKNESTASLALKRHSIVIENGLNSTKKLRSSIAGPSSNTSSYSAPTTPKNFNNLTSNGEHTTSLDDNSSSTSKNFGAARAILADRLKNSQKNRKKFQPKEETINEGICFKPNGLVPNDREVSLDRKGDIFIDLTGTKSSLANNAPTTQNGDYFSFSELPTSNNDRRLSYPVSATFQNSLISDTPPPDY